MEVPLGVDKPLGQRERILGLKGHNLVLSGDPDSNGRAAVQNCAYDQTASPSALNVICSQYISHLTRRMFSLCASTFSGVILKMPRPLNSSVNSGFRSEDRY